MDIVGRLPEAGFTPGNLKYLMKTKQWKRIDVARICKVGQQNVTKWRGGSSMPHDKWKQLVEAAHTSDPKNALRNVQKYKKTRRKVALWNDVLKALDGMPYRGCIVGDIAPQVMSQSKKQGYLAEAPARRLREATCGRLKLTDHEDARKSSKRRQAE